MQTMYGSMDNPEEHERLCEFVSRRIGQRLNPEMSSAIAIVTANGAGAVVYDCHDGVNMHMHVAGEGYWLTREALAEYFGYPFLRAGCRRVTAVIDAKNRKSRKFCERLGFKREGTVRKAMPNGHNAVIYGMLKEECRWLPKQEDKQDGQIDPVTAAAA